MRSASALRRCCRRLTTKDWRAVAAREAKKAGTTLDALTSTTKESLEIQPCYFGADDEAAPGVFPYRRGAYATMYAANPWTVRQYASFSSADSTTGESRPFPTDEWVQTLSGQPRWIRGLAAMVAGS